MRQEEENKNEIVEKRRSDNTESVVDNRKPYNYDNHINELLKEILSYNRQDGLDKFEELSMYIKKKMTKLSFQYFVPHQKFESKIELTNFEQKLIKDTLKKKSKNTETINSYMQDIMSQSRLLEWAGVSFNKTEWYKLSLAMKKLLVDYDAQYIKFWGKIYAQNSDYYIIQGTLKEYVDNLKPNPNMEKRGAEGVNRYVFWVSNNVLEDWYELPNVTSDQIRASKLSKVLLTGDLNSKVVSFNYFPGTEAHLLKCQIIRIMHGSSIIPVDYLKIKTETDENLQDKTTEFNEEFVNPAFEEMNSLEKWCHEYGHVLNAGRILHTLPTSEETLEKDKYIPRLNPLAGDEPFSETRPCWNVRQVGDPQVFTAPQGKEGTSTYAGFILKNLRWPGSLCIYKNNEFVNIYIGDGVKYGGSVFIPTEPSDQEIDPEGVAEFPEPNPDKEPVIEKAPDEEGGEPKQDGDMEDN